MLQNNVFFQCFQPKNPSKVCETKNNAKQTPPITKNNPSLELMDKNYNALLINKNPSFGAKSLNVGASLKDILAKIDLKALNLELSSMGWKKDFFSESISGSFLEKDMGRITGGTIKTHPHFNSSNGSELPKSKEEIVDLYRKHIPERYQEFVKLGIFDHNDLATIDGKLAGRYAPQDEHTEINMKKAIQRGMVDPKKHVVIVDLGGPHSIAAARELGKSGYVIIPHFNHQKLDYANQDTGALSYFAKEISDINANTLEKNPNAPWAMVLDCHQNDMGDEFLKILKDKDIPPIPQGYNVMWLTEGTNPVLKSTWEYNTNLIKNRGAQSFDLGLDPYGRGTLFYDKGLEQKNPFIDFKKSYFKDGV